MPFTKETARQHGAKGGRPKGTKDPHTREREAQKALHAQQVYAAQERITAAQIASACGLNYLVARERKTGKFVRLSEEMAQAIISGADADHEMLEVWKEAPSAANAKDLFDRALDKPVEPHTMDLNVTLNIEARKSRLKTAIDRADEK